MQPILTEGVKLALAGVIGLLITWIHSRGLQPQARKPGLEHAQILMCICGALITLVVGDSMARAVGLLGGASIVRFRTPVKDPRDTAVLFVLLALGMACGLGAFATAGLGTAFFASFLAILRRARPAIAAAAVAGDEQ